MKLLGGRRGIPGKLSPQPNLVVCPKWFVGYLLERLAAIGVQPTGIREIPVREDEIPLFDPELDATCHVCLPWEIDVPRVKFVLELCDFCARNRMDEKRLRQTGEDRAS